MLTALLGLLAFLSKPPSELEAPAAVLADDPKPAAPAPTTAESVLQETWGIQPIGLHLTVGGSLLDFRYRVVDPAKAALLLKQQQDTTFLLDPANGQKVSLSNASRSGSLHRAAGELLRGHSYFMHFPNPGRQFQAGSKLTLVMGSFKAENLTVQ